MKFWASLTDQVRELLLQGRGNQIGPLLDSNFNQRCQIYQIGEGNLRMIETARAAGASAKFPGSGGAIVGTYPDEATYERLQQRLGAMGVKVFKPVILPED
jgi:glucuronokinase